MYAIKTWKDGREAFYGLPMGGLVSPLTWRSRQEAEHHAIMLRVSGAYDRVEVVAAPRG